MTSQALQIDPKLYELFTIDHCLRQTAICSAYSSCSSTTKQVMAKLVGLYADSNQCMHSDLSLLMGCAELTHTVSSCVCETYERYTAFVPFPPCLSLALCRGPASQDWQPYVCIDTCPLYAQQHLGKTGRREQQADVSVSLWKPL